MHVPNLAQLHANMVAQRLTKTKFDFRFRTLSFSVIYIAELFPHTLLVGCRAHNLFFVIEVRKGYNLTAYLGGNYRPLMDALHLQRDPANPFSPAVLFNALADAVPLTTCAANTPAPTDIARLSRDVEEADKVYFMGWTVHDGKKSDVSEKNLAKTLRLCGSATHAHCRRNHISSRWTDDEARATQYREPPAL